jgi:hypothetical protein
VTPRGTLRGIAACRLSASEGERRRAIRHGTGGPDSENIEGDVIARTHEIARWRETGEVAYKRDFAVRLTLNNEGIVRVVVMPGSALPSQVNSGSPAD